MTAKRTGAELVVRALEDEGIALAFGIERVVLRPLVNQAPIILFMATIGLTRVGAMIRLLTIVGEATMRYAPLRCGLSTSARQYSLPVAGSWPETTSPPVMINSARPFASIHAGVM